MKSGGIKMRLALIISTLKCLLKCAEMGEESGTTPRKGEITSVRLPSRLN